MAPGEGAHRWTTPDSPTPPTRISWPSTSQASRTRSVSSYAGTATASGPWPSAHWATARKRQTPCRTPWSPPFAPHTFRGQSAVTTWLHRITVNACLDRARKAASRKTAPVDDAERLDQLLEPHESAEAPAERQDLHRELLAALATLPAEQRAALVLVDMQAHPVAEAARVLDVPTGTVKSRCARGRARLLPLLSHLRTTRGDSADGAVGRNRTQGASVPPISGPRDAGESDPAAVKGGGGHA